MQTKRIVLLGAGNVAHHLAAALLKSDLNLCQIYSRSIESARELGMKTGIAYTADPNVVYPDADIYIFCVSDDALVPVYKSIRIHNGALLLHTSGSLPLGIFDSCPGAAGVLYPLQTFSKKRELDFSEIPLCIEASNAKTLKLVQELAEALSHRVIEVDSERRKILHLSAVFACNFVNHLYRIAGDLLEQNGLDFALLRPLIFETAHKVMLLSPEEAQTGPARRGDDKILNMHKSLLKKDKKWAELYALLSDLIKEGAPKPEIKEGPLENGEHPLMLTLW
ncbi:MAG: DUF2520 domain-containing protein [Culturomica sp.]|jgi:predicted short-subunit dehydrogenase-like oxidoreductase (DUF2520 family)|nr:DUF2520 domain-containing protein [Culturomica sp.]